MKTNIYSFLIILAIALNACKTMTTKTMHHKLWVEGVEKPVISLNGTWKLSMAPPEKFWENEVDFSSWSDILVPGECQMQGFAIKHDQPYAYKKKFTVPLDYNGKQVLLHFFGVYSYARVWVNGRFVREHYGGFTKWSCDITDWVVPGESAILTVEMVDRTDDVSYASGYAKHQIGGILRDVELAALPRQNFKQFHFETHLDEHYQHAELKVFYELTQRIPSSIKLELLDAEGASVGDVEKNIDEKVGQLVVPVKNPLKWDAEHPNLYTLQTTLFENGKAILQTESKVGFRELKVEGNKLLVNGKPVKLRGACRHDIHPTLGRTTTPEYDLKDVLLAKESNMNFIRTSHYPPTEAFLDYCDEHGIYVEDETAVCFVGSHRTLAYQATGASADDPAFREQYLFQLEEMVQNHRNHPSIIIWSIGNESTFGSNFAESFKWVKTNDPTRPVIFSYPGNVPQGIKAYDILSMHYPAWNGDLEQYGIETKGFEYESMPVLFDEWAHVACYNNFELKEDPNARNFWGQSLDKMWTLLFEADGGLGGAIWCMLDETFMLPDDLEGFNEWWGILDKDIIPSRFEGPTVGYGEWGIVDTWRRKKPEFWLTKKAYSPTKIHIKQIHDFQPNEALSIPIFNRFDHTNFSELRIVWKYGNNSGVLQNVALGPHEKGNLVLPPNEWNSDEPLNIRFYQNDTFLIDEYNLQLGEKTIDLPVCKKGDLKINETPNQIVLSGKSFEVEINKKTGLLENLKVDGELLVETGPFINLKYPGKEVQFSTIEMDDYAQNWTLKDFSFETIDGIATLHTSGLYDKIAARFSIQIDDNGVFMINYEIEDAPNGKKIQEEGIKFLTGDAFEKLSWERNAYFSAYPKNHLGSPYGEVDVHQKPPMAYRQEPQHDWELDTKGFYYLGLEPKFSYNNIVRSMKENIYSYSLKTGANSVLAIVAAGTQACRFDKVNDRPVIIINNQWDYNSLQWGNYMKNITGHKRMVGSVILKVGKNTSTKML